MDFKQELYDMVDKQDGIVNIPKEDLDNFFEETEDINYITLKGTVEEVTNQIINDSNLKKSDNVIVAVYGTSKMTLYENETIVDEIRKNCIKDVSIIFISIIDDSIDNPFIVKAYAGQKINK